MKFSQVIVAAAALLTVASSPSAQAQTPPTELARRAAQALFECAEQPYGFDAETGRKKYGFIRSRCADTVQISEDRVVFATSSGSYTFFIQDSAQSDGGDLNDLFLVADHSTEIASGILAFSDPALALLLLGGHSADELPQVADPSIR